MAPDKRELLRSLEIDRDQPAAPSSRRRWPVFLAALLVAIPAAIAIIWVVAPDAVVRARVAETNAAATTPAPVMPAAVPETRRTSLVASGYVVARRKATVAAEVTGKVIEVNVEEGKVVAQGQVLARLDSVLAEADLELARSRQAGAEAAVQSVVADLRDAEQTLSRTQSLSRREFATAADLIKAEARVGMLRAQLQKARAEAGTARLDVGRAGEVVEKHSIRAPFGGVVVEKSAQPGEMISPLSAGGGFTRTGICTIVDMGSIEVEVDVNEAFIGRIRAGQRVAAVLDAYPDWTIPAAVIAIVPTANREKATVKVRIGFNEKDARILPDMAVKVTFSEAGGPAAAAASSPG